MQYFAQDEATRLDPALTVYETLASGSPLHMVPMIRNILGGFLFTGDDVYKHVRVLSGGERTRLAVARMLLRPANTLLLDEPTNHLDLDSKDVLLDALEDFGGTLIFVSHDRYFVERLATKIVEVGNGALSVYPGTYREFLWHKEHPREARAPAERESRGTPNGKRPSPRPERPSPRSGHKGPARKRTGRMDVEARRRQRESQGRQARIDGLETEIAECEAAIKQLEHMMSTPGFYDDRAVAQPIIDRHQALMWQVGDLMHRWEELLTEA
jgi:ATP-binding cassette subfamily F protein 3